MTAHPRIGTTRRDLLKGALLTLLLPPGALLAGGPLGGLPSSDEAFLNRLTFGATPESRAALVRLGRAAWLDDQLARPARDAALDARLGALRLRIAYEAGEDEAGAWDATDEMRPLLALDADPAALLHLLSWEEPLEWSERVRPAWEVIAASLPRAVHAEAQVREVMTQFWHDHFNVQSMKDEGTAVFFPSHDAALRTHALGRFRDLLGAVAASPAMLLYLNQADSRASPANENFARELLELHTLGAGAYLNEHGARWSDVPQEGGLAVGYVDEDVYEVARAFTGWTVGDGRWVAEGQEAPLTGRLAYVEGWHDPYQKRVLGREFAPNRAPLADGEEVLDILATHPATARHVCGKIARRLLADEPDAGLVERLAGVFLDNGEAPDQIARVVRVLALDPAFDAASTKLRRPFEVLAALYRASGVDVASPEASFHWQLERAGWHQHTFGPPNGHPDTLPDWEGGVVLLRTVEMALSAHDEWFGCTATRLSAALPSEVRTLGDLVAFWAERACGPGAEAPAELWAALDADPADPLPEDEAERHDLSAAALAMAALSPRFLLR